MEDLMPPDDKSKMLRVAVLTTSYPISPGSTSGVFVARLLGAMPDTVSITVITPASRTASTTTSQETNLQVRDIRYAPNTWQRLAHEPGGLPVALQKEPWLRVLAPVLVFALAFGTLREARSHHLIHANWAFNGCIAGLTGLLTGRPVLTSLRGVDVSRAKKSWFAKLSLSLAIGLSRTIVAVSTDMAEWLRGAYPEAARKIVVVENGVDVSFFAAYDVHRSRVPHATPVLVCGGNLIPRKGHSVLLRALSRCVAYRWKLQLAGDGSERSELVRLAGELDLMDRIEFLGELPPEAMPAFLANADLFVLPSFSEGRSNALLEAMAAGIPVVASSINGVTELVEDGRTGRTFPPGNYHALATVILTLLQNTSTLAQLGDAAHLEICRRKLTWAGAAEQYLSHYQKLVGIA